MKENNSSITVLPSRQMLKKPLKDMGLYHTQWIREELKTYDQYALNILQKAPMPRLDFVMMPSSMQNIAIAHTEEQYTGAFFPYITEYFSVSKDGTMFILDIRSELREKKNGECERKIIPHLLKKNRYETAEVFDMASLEWRKDRDVDVLATIEIEQKPETEILETLQNGLAIPLASEMTDSIKSMIDMSEPLIHLRNNVGNKSRLKLVCMRTENQNGEKETGIIPVLTASSPYLFGACVLMNPEGNLMLCLLDTDAEKTERKDVYFPQSMGNIRKVRDCPDSEELKSLLKNMWSREDDGRMHFLMPNHDMTYKDICEEYDM